MDACSLRQGVSPGQRMGLHMLFFLSKSPWDPTEQELPSSSALTAPGPRGPGQGGKHHSPLSEEAFKQVVS